MGEVVWFEVMGKDGGALRGFYGQLFGWRFGAGPGDYGLADAEQTGIPGGVGSVEQGPGHTTFYVQVDDLDQSLGTAARLGGRVLMPATEMPDGGRIALFADPEGHPVGLVQVAG